MAIVTTPGAVDAVAYADVVAFQAFCTARGLSYGSSSDTAIEGALVRAADWLDGRYEDRFPGRAATAEQAMAWPRVEAVDTSEYPLEGVPEALIRANSAAALFELANAGGLTRTYTPLEGKVLTEVKGIKWSLVNDPSVKDGWRLVLPLVDDLLARVLLPRRPFPYAAVV